MTVLYVVIIPNSLALTSNTLEAAHTMAIFSLYRTDGVPPHIGTSKTKVTVPNDVLFKTFQQNV